MSARLTEMCQYLNNWFDRGRDKWIGSFVIADNTISFVPQYSSEGFVLKDGQYFRILGSVLNDGVHLFPPSDLVDESFEGSVWAMAVPPAVIALCNEIDEWEGQYGGVNGAVMSPYQSESFGGYSYSKSSGATRRDSGSASSFITWRDAFDARLTQYKKLKGC